MHQTYTVLRTTLMPSGDQVEVQLNPMLRGSDKLKGVLMMYCRPDEAPKAGDRMVVSVTVEASK